MASLVEVEIMALLKCMPVAVQELYHTIGTVTSLTLLSLQNLSAGDVSVVVFDANFCQKDSIN